LLPPSIESIRTGGKDLRFVNGFEYERYETVPPYLETFRRVGVERGHVTPVTVEGNEA
jgi:hypothetical protein